MMIGFGIIAFYRWYQTHLIFFLLLVLRDFTAGYFFFKRNPSQTKIALLPKMFAYLSSAMPLFYFEPMNVSKELYLTSDLLAILGFLIVVFATLELGTSIGIAPANRGIVRSGIYRFIKHPMYTGYIISEIGMVLLNKMSLLLFVVSTSLYIYRAKNENKLLKKEENKTHLDTA